MAKTQAVETIRVIIADDHPVVRQGLRAMLQRCGVEVVAEARDGEEAVDLAKQFKPDVVLMDLRMPRMDGLAATRVLRQELPDIATIIITSFETRDHLRSAIEAGAVGYLLKGASRDVLLQAVRLVKEGGSLIDAKLLAELAKDTTAAEERGASPTIEGLMASLSPREVQVLQLLSHGLTNKDIAQQMHYSVGTVKNVVQRIIEKLSVSDRTQAAVYAVRAGLDID